MRNRNATSITINWREWTQSRDKGTGPVGRYQVFFRPAGKEDWIVVANEVNTKFVFALKGSPSVMACYFLNFFSQVNYSDRFVTRKLVRVSGHTRARDGSVGTSFANLECFHLWELVLLEAQLSSTYNMFFIQSHILTLTY